MPGISAEDLFAELDSENFWEGHLVDPGNIYDQVGYFVAFPTWWRRFAFRVLEQRDIAVYLYVCSYMSTQRSSRPTIKTIAHDFGNTNRHGVTSSLKRLVDRGFLVRRKMASLIIDESHHPRYVYQRPAIAFTLATLLSQGLINGYLQPTSKTLRRGQEKLAGRIDARLGKPLVDPLKSLIGDDAFAEYAKLRNEAEKRQHLIERLNAVVEALRTEAKATGKL
jgi:predicted transcriptional regulator